MKTKNIFLSLIALLFVIAMPFKAQEVEKVNYYKNNPELGGDVVITNSINETVGNECYTTFQIIAPSEGDYYINFWLLPAKYVDDTYTTFKVLVNGNNVGRIVPTKGNWQSIGLPDNAKVSLNKGENSVSLVTNIPEIPQAEFVRLSKIDSKSKISSVAFDTYLAKAKNSEMGISILMDDIDTAIEPELEEIVNAVSASPDFKLFTNVPLKYSIRTSYQFTAGQEIFITTNSKTQHVLDFYIATGNGDPQYLSWLNVSESSLSSPTTYLATIRATIPITGTYWVKVRSYGNGVSGTVNINVNGQYSLTNSPIYYAGRNVVIPANGKSYAVFTMSNDSDPYVFVEGAGSTPGKIVAYNDDAPATNRDEYGLRSYDSYVAKSYAMPVSAVHVNCYGSSTPESKCHVAVQTSTVNTFAVPQKSNGNERNGATGVSQGNRMAMNIYPNPIDISSVLNIDASGDLSKVEVYDISGRLVQIRDVDSPSVQIPMFDLNIDKPGIYLVKLVGTSDSITKQLIVR